MIRIAGTILCVAAHALLGVTVCSLFPFLMGGQPPRPDEAAPAWWLVDALLVLQFGAVHSLLLQPVVRRRVERFLPAPLYGCLFTLVTCVTLLVMIHGWQTSPLLLWQLEGGAATAMYAGYVLGWVGLLYTLRLGGYGWQTGWTPYWAWVRRLPPPRRRFETTGPYRLMRHPTYLCFLALVWFTPVVTLDRGLLMGLLTGYIVLGSWLKDRRLVYFLGDAYRRYQARVPGYPLLGWGPLGRVPFETEAVGHPEGEACSPLPSR